MIDIDLISFGKSLLNDRFFHVVIVLCVFDIIIGTVRAGIDKEIHSTISRKGITSHIVTMITIIVMNWVLAVIGYNEFSKIFITFYIASYSISIIENTGRMGVKYPQFIQNIFTELQGVTNENKGFKNRNQKSI